MKGFEFSPKRAVQALGYIQSKCFVTDKLSLIKLLFFADRYHLRAFCISMLEDNYKALRKGPVCSYTLDLINKSNYYNQLSRDEQNYVSENLSINGWNVTVKERNTDSLSKSALQALDFAIDNFSKFDPYDLVEIAHSYPEWKKFEDFLRANPQKSKDMSFVDFFDNPESDDSVIQEYFSGKDPYAMDEKYLAASKTEYLKYS